MNSRGMVQFIFEKALMAVNFDGAWKELKAGIDTGLDSATDGVKRGWQEFSGGIDRALEGFMSDRNSRV